MSNKELGITKEQVIYNLGLYLQTDGETIPPGFKSSLKYCLRFLATENERKPDNEPLGGMSEIDELAEFIAESTVKNESSKTLAERLINKGWHKPMPVFQLGEFALHSGKQSNFKIECDALTDKDWFTLARMITDKVKFDKVIGVPTGGEKLARELRAYSINGYPTLIVDDVLTTGKSMEEMKQTVHGEVVIGYVVFARNICPSWITALFQMDCKPVPTPCKQVKEE